MAEPKFVKRRKNSPNNKRIKNLKGLLAAAEVDDACIVEWQASTSSHLSVLVVVHGRRVLVGGAPCTPGDTRADKNFVSKVKRAVRELGLM
jgi:hypothetical protein